MRPRLACRSVLGLVLAAGAATGCHDGPTERTGGETNWLRACATAADCDSAPCTCGVCAAECGAGDPCAEAETCAVAESDVWQRLCADATASGVCLPACVEPSDCAPGYACQDGACAPEVRAGVALLAFPGAEGFGAHVTGGRGGRVIKVTNLEPSGPGSLQAALELDEPRIVVFEVSGVIDANLVSLPYGNVTIAGQSAPGGGLTLRGRIQANYVTGVSNVVIRHLRIRPEFDGSEPEQFDGLQLSEASRVMLDHVSVAYAVDEAIDIWNAQDVTVQWCTIETPNVDVTPPGPYAQGVVAGTTAERVSVHHTLVGHQPGAALGIPSGPTEVVASVFYDARSGFTHGETARGPFALVDNTFRIGPNADLLPYVFDDQAATPAADLSYYLSGNVYDGDSLDCPAGPVDDPWTQCNYDLLRDASLRSTEPPDLTVFSGQHVAVSTAGAALGYDAVLTHAGAFPRDAVTLNLVADVLDRSGVVGGAPPADLQTGLTPSTAPLDSDDDGMPDEWERDCGLDPQDPADQNAVLESGYPAIEQYLNDLAAALLQP